MKKRSSANRYIKSVTIGIIYTLSIGISLNAQVRSTTKLKGHSSEKGKIVSTYTNPVLRQNFPDPTVIKTANGYYYAYGTNNTINGIAINIQVAKSKDLVDWQNAGDALPAKPNWANKDFWAPHVSYDKNNKTYYLYYSGESISDSIGKCLGVATSTNPEGPFTDKGTPLLCGETFVNIDPMAFDDPATGKKLLYWGSGFKAIKVQELADDRLSFKAGSVAAEVMHPIANSNADNYQKLIEGAWVFYYGGYYYLLYSGDNCCGENAHYAVMAARSKSATGPFQTMAEAAGSKNSVILERNKKWKGPGHNSVVKDAANQNWMVYHAIDTTMQPFGRVMLIDKIKFENGWPVIATGTPSAIAQKAPMVNISNSNTRRVDVKKKKN